MNSSRTVRYDSGFFLVSGTNRTVFFFRLFFIHKGFVFLYNWEKPKDQIKKKELLLGHVKSRSWTQPTICNGLVILCSGLRNAPPIQLQAPSQSPTGATIVWRFSQADRGSPPNWLDQGRAFEVSCDRGTERVLDRYPLQL